jgi:hypothetical protein
VKLVMRVVVGLLALVGLIAPPAASAAPHAARAGLAPSPAVARSTGQTARSLPVAYDCRGWHHGQVRSAQIAISCFGTVVVHAARWARWTRASARSASATLGIDMCKPNCSSGRFRKYAATVTLYRVRRHRGVPYFSRLRLRYRHRGPRHYTYRWVRYPGATIPVWVGGPAGRPPR